MIKWLELQNFKCYQHLRLSFGNLTLLTGFNGGGKSTAIQPGNGRITLTPPARLK